MIGRDIAHPFGEETRDIHVEGGRAREDLGVSGPAQPLVALRTISRDIQEIALLPPQDIVLQLVDKRLRGRKIAGRPDVGMNDDAGQAVEIEFTRITFNRDITKSLKGEVRLVDFDSATLERVPVGLFRGAQVVDIEIALFIKHLGVPQRDGRPGGSLHFHPHPADHVLSKIDDRQPGRGFHHFDGLYLFDFTNRRAGRRDQFLFRMIDDFHTRPAGIGE